MFGKSGGGEGGGGPSATLAALESKLLVIETRVEQIRGQDFIQRPLPSLVNGAAVRREGLAELDRVTPVRVQAADDELLKLLGLIPPQSNLRAIETTVLGEQVAGFYDPRTKRLALVSDTGAQDESVAEITLAHELTHALDDQRFGLRDQPSDTDDRASAYTALVEGDATAVMSRYATQYLTGADLLGALFAGSSASGQPLPPYIEASLEFPYLEGQRFIEALYRYAHGWKLVNYAFRFRPPASTAQILHPLLYVHDRKPLRIRMRVRPLLGRDWRRVISGSLGEFDTRQLLQRGIDAAHADQIAAAWRGGSYELWRTGSLPNPECPGPCRPRDSLVLAWRTAPGRDAQMLSAALGAYVVRGLGAHPEAEESWTLPGGGSASLTTRGGNTVLAFAPSKGLAASLAAQAVVSAA